MAVDEDHVAHTEDNRSHRHDEERDVSEEADSRSTGKNTTADHSLASGTDRLRYIEAVRTREEEVQHARLS